MRAIERANIGTRPPRWPEWQLPAALSALGKLKTQVNHLHNASYSSLVIAWQCVQYCAGCVHKGGGGHLPLRNVCNSNRKWENEGDVSLTVSIQTAVNTPGSWISEGSVMALKMTQTTTDVVLLRWNMNSWMYAELDVRYMCVRWLMSFCVFPAWFISMPFVYPRVCFKHACAFVWLFFFFFFFPTPGTCVRGLAQGSTPPCGWHSECIITINEKVNGAFSYISIYIWTIWVPQMMSGRSRPTPLSTGKKNKKKQGGLMCFHGHQMLWIMTRPLNANQMTLDRPWSTMPAWKLSPTDTMKSEGGGA